MIHKLEIAETKIVLDVHSGAVHVVDDLSWQIIDDYNYLSVEEITSKYSQSYPLSEVEEVLNEIALLKDKGILYSEDNYTRKRQERPSQPVVKSICLNVSHDCNLRCKYCFAGSGHFGGGRKLMSVETGRQAIDFLLKNSAERRHCELDFFGGEPLMNIKTVKELVAYGKEKAAALNKEIKFTLTTNALLLDGDVTEFLNKENISVVLSLDGRPTVNDDMRLLAGSGRGSYAYIRPKISSFIESRNNENYIVRGTYTRYNTDFAMDVLHLADLGYKYISVEPVVGDPMENWSLQETDLPDIFGEYDTLVKAYVKRMKEGRPFEFFHFNLDLNDGPCLPKRLSGCGAGHEYMAVTPEGELYPCHQFVGREQYRLGTVSGGIDNMELVERFQEAHIYNKEKCISCWAKFHCGGGCHANAEVTTGKITEPYNLGCELEKKRLECAIYIQVLKAAPNEL